MKPDSSAFWQKAAWKDVVDIMEAFFTDAEKSSFDP